MLDRFALKRLLLRPWAILDEPRDDGEEGGRFEDKFLVVDANWLEVVERRGNWLGQELIENKSIARRNCGFRQRGGVVFCAIAGISLEGEEEAPIRAQGAKSKKKKRYLVIKVKSGHCSFLYKPTKKQLCSKSVVLPVYAIVEGAANC